MLDFRGFHCFNMFYWFLGSFLDLIFKFVFLCPTNKRTKFKQGRFAAAAGVVTGSPSTHNNVKFYENQGLNLD